MTAVDLGSLSRAAEVVGYPQSGLTHLVDRLEREIGLTLVQRDHSGIALTEEGNALMPCLLYTSLIHAHIDQMPVIKPGTLHGIVRNIEAQRL